MFDAPSVLPEDFMIVEAGEGRDVVFYSLIPLYQEELDFSMRAGTEALEDRLDKGGVTAALNPRRKSVVRKKLFGVF